jgi:hypothetical protein
MFNSLFPIHNEQHFKKYRRNTFRVTISHSPITRGNLSSVNLVSIFRCSSPPRNPVYPRRVDSSTVSFSLSSHRHSCTSLLFDSHFINNILSWISWVFIVLLIIVLTWHFLPSVFSLFYSDVNKHHRFKIPTLVHLVCERLPSLLGLILCLS